MMSDRTMVTRICAQWWWRSMLGFVVIVLLLPTSGCGAAHGTAGNAASYENVPCSSVEGDDDQSASVERSQVFFGDAAREARDEYPRDPNTALFFVEFPTKKELKDRYDVAADGGETIRLDGVESIASAFEPADSAALPATEIEPMSDFIHSVFDSRYSGPVLLSYTAHLDGPVISWDLLNEEDQVVANVPDPPESTVLYQGVSPDPSITYSSFRPVYDDSATSWATLNLVYGSFDFRGEHVWLPMELDCDIIAELALGDEIDELGPRALDVAGLLGYVDATSPSIDELRARAEEVEHRRDAVVARRDEENARLDQESASWEELPANQRLISDAPDGVLANTEFVFAAVSVPIAWMNQPDYLVCAKTRVALQGCVPIALFKPAGDGRLAMDLEVVRLSDEPAIIYMIPPEMNTFAATEEKSKGIGPKDGVHLGKLDDRRLTAPRGEAGDIMPAVIVDTELLPDELVNAPEPQITRTLGTCELQRGDDITWRCAR